MQAAREELAQKQTLKEELSCLTLLMKEEKSRVKGYDSDKTAETAHFVKILYNRYLTPPLLHHRPRLSCFFWTLVDISGFYNWLR